MGMEKVPNQVHLSLKQTVRISLNSLKIRMGRSLITLSGVILAIAFLASIWFNQDIINGLKLAAVTDENLGTLLKNNNVSIKLTGLDDKTKFLIILSLLVSAVGIVNALLMSVTERYKEIGTMKCLGALDSLIVRLFVIESSILGLVGAAIGVVIGFLIAYTPACFAYGKYVWSVFSLFDFVKSAGYSIAIGVVLSIIFAIYPAYLAAKMKPVDAMRVEA